jgi:methyl-accepting chemotaxis protein
VVKAPGKSSPTRRLTMLYICALSSVAIISVIGQIIIQLSLAQQGSDAGVINIAGRQRMLSQRLSKAALVLEVTTDPTERATRSQELQQVVALWESSQQGLQQGDLSQGLPGNNSPQVTHLFASINPSFEAMLTAAKELLAILAYNPSIHGDMQKVLGPFVQTILNNEGTFLIGMNQIVSQYQVEAEARVSTLKSIELALLVITLLVLLLEGSFIFRPTTHKLNTTIAEIVTLEQSIAKQKMELEAGIQQLLQTHVQAANGDFNVRAPLTQDHVLWQIAYSLNNLLSRIQRLSQTESDLIHVRTETSRVVGGLQSQANHVRNELQLIQADTAMLLKAVRDAKAKGVPIRLPQSHSILEPICIELTGNYIQPILPGKK